MPSRLVSVVLMFLAAVSLGGIAGCNPQAKGFALPPGDAEAGRSAFIEIGCNACHSVVGQVELAIDASAGNPHVVLGGEVTRIKTYGDLVTSIINPSHRLSRGDDARTLTSDGETLMPSYNSVMSILERSVKAMIAPSSSMLLK